MSGLGAGALVWAALQPVLKVILLCGVGAVCVRLGILDYAGRKTLSSLAFLVFTPCLNYGALSASVTPQRLVQWWPLIVNVLITHVLGAMLGLLNVWLIPGQPRRFRRHIVAVCMFGNTGNLPLVIVTTLARSASELFSSGSISADEAEALGISYVMIGILFSLLFVPTIGYKLTAKSADEDEADTAQALQDGGSAAAAASAPMPPAAAPCAAAKSDVDVEKAALPGGTTEAGPLHDVPHAHHEESWLLEAHDAPSCTHGGAHDARRGAERLPAPLAGRADADALHDVALVSTTGAESAAEAAALGLPGAPVSTGAPSPGDLSPAGGSPACREISIELALSRGRLIPDSDAACVGTSSASPTGQLSKAFAPMPVQQGQQEQQRQQEQQQQQQQQLDGGRWGHPVPGTANLPPGSSPPRAAGGTVLRLSRFTPEFMSLARIQSAGRLAALREDAEAAAAAAPAPALVRHDDGVCHGFYVAACDHAADSCNVPPAARTPASSSVHTPLIAGRQLSCGSTAAAATASSVPPPGAAAIQMLPAQLVAAPGWVRRVLRSARQLLRDLATNPNVLTSLLALLVGCVPALRGLLIGDDAPLALVQSAVVILGACCIPTIMIGLGATLAHGPGGGALPLRTQLSTGVCRLVVLPLLGMGIVIGGYAAGAYAAPDAIFILVMLIQNTVPTAIMVHTMSAVHSNMEAEISTLLFWQYLVCVVTIPPYLAFYLWAVGEVYTPVAPPPASL